MASLDSQGEIAPVELPDPEETVGWQRIGTFPQHLTLTLLPVIAVFMIWHATIGCYGKGLIDVEENQKSWNVFDNVGHELPLNFMLIYTDLAKAKLLFIYIVISNKL